jgi:hypothetical protein
MKTSCLLLLSTCAYTLTVPSLPHVDWQQGLPVSAACSAGFVKVEGAPPVASALQTLSLALQTQAAAAGGACGPEIQTNKTVRSLLSLCIVN